MEFKSADAFTLPMKKAGDCISFLKRRFLGVQRHRSLLAILRNAPVGLGFLQEVYLLLHAGAGLELLHHHLSGVQARVDLPQQHLNMPRTKNRQGESLKR